MKEQRQKVKREHDTRFPEAEEHLQMDGAYMKTKWSAHEVHNIYSIYNNNNEQNKV
jgi:hypothetical protein